MNYKILISLMFVCLLLTGCDRYSLGEEREKVHEDICKSMNMTYTRQPNFMNGVNFHNFYCLDGNELKEFYIDNYYDYELVRSS